MNTLPRKVTDESNIGTSPVVRRKSTESKLINLCSIAAPNDDYSIVMVRMKDKPHGMVLLVIDVQDRIIDTITDHALVVENIRALIKVCQVLEVPVLSTEQEKLGKTVSELTVFLGKHPISKLTFSCCGKPELMRELDRLRRKTVIVCGIETHICVLQTVLDLLKRRYAVQIARDATSSHNVIDRETALERMQVVGGTITTTETLIYELTERAGTSDFRRILSIVKERRKLLKTDNLVPHFRE